MFTRLFKNKARSERKLLNHADGNVRLEALTKIAQANQLEAQQINALATSDTDVRVRRRAIEYLMEHSQLQPLLEDPETAEAAAARLVALDPNTSNPHPAVVNTLLSLGRIPPAANLDNLTPAQLIEITIISRGEAQAALLQSNSYQQASTLVLLERASRDKVKNLNRFARERLDELKRKRAECELHQQRLQELLSALEKHLDADPDSAGYQDKHQTLLRRARDSFACLQSAANALLIHAEEPVPVAVLQQRLEAIPEATATIPSATATLVEVADPFIALMPELKTLAGELRQHAELDAMTRAFTLFNERWHSASTVMQPSANQQAALDKLAADVNVITQTQNRLLQTLASGAQLTFATTPPKHPEAADRYWRQVAAGRKWLRQAASLRRDVSLPGWLVISQSLQQLEELTTKQSAALAAVDAAEAALSAALQEKLELLQSQIEQGESKAAQRLLAECRNSLRILPHSSAEHSAPTLNQCAARLGELKDWQTFATSPKRQALCVAMTALADAPLAPADQAVRIKELREQWLALGETNQSADRAMADQFDADAQRAFAICRDYFTEQAEIRAANLLAREQICQQLAQYLETTDWQHCDVKAAEQILRTARNEWRRFHPVDRKAGKILDARFEELQATLHQHIKAQWERNLGDKQQIVVEAAALLESADPVLQRIEAIKALQNRWRAIGATPRGPDQQLWQQFRASCDAIFAQRDSEQIAADEASAATAASARMLLEEFAALSQQPVENSRSANSRPAREIEADFRALPALPERLQRELESQFEKLQQNYRSAQQALAKSQRADELDSSVLADPIPGAGEPTVSAEALRRLVVEAEIAAQLESVAEDRDLRMSIQVEMMNQRRGPDLFNLDPKSLVNQWLESGCKPPGVEALRDRFRAAITALNKH